MIYLDEWEYSNKADHPHCPKCQITLIWDNHNLG